MIEIKLHNPVANEANAWLYWWDGYEGVFSLEFVQKLFDEHPDEKDFKFNIHCPGGEVEEGLAIYDCLRTSGRNIYMNIEGGCHSMAVTLLLAAPKENRTANPNCLALIHQVQGYAGGSADELEKAAEEARMLQNKILDIYADRTGMDRAELETIMNEQKERTAEELLAWGFISRINAYNTNLKPSKNQRFMSKETKKNLKQRASEFLNSLLGAVGVVTNYEFTDPEGNVLFETEEESDALVEGETKASPDGVFTIADGRTVTIEGGVVTKVEEASGDGGEGDGGEGGEEGNAKTGEGETNLEEQVTNLKAENANLKQQLSDAAELIKELRANIKSNYQVPARQNGQKRNTRVQPTAKTSSDIKEEIRNNRKKNGPKAE